MRSDFEWHAEKAARNWRDHGVTFEQGAKAIRDPFAIEWVDDRESYGEERINLLGMCGGVILHVTYTERDPAIIWIISARSAEKHEQDRYYRENAL